MSACPVKCLPNEMQGIFHRGEAYSSEVVKIFVFLELEPWLNKKADLTGQAKMSIFQRSQCFIYIRG